MTPHSLVKFTTCRLLCYKIGGTVSHQFNLLNRRVANKITSLALGLVYTSDFAVLKTHKSLKSEFYAYSEIKASSKSAKTQCKMHCKTDV